MTAILATGAALWLVITFLPSTVALVVLGIGVMVTAGLARVVTEWGDKPEDRRDQ